MKILKPVYDSMLNKTPQLPPETGGILGGKDGIVTEIYFDKPECLRVAPARYIPDIKALNQVISNWENNGMAFYGIFHSHYSQDSRLSNGDIEYILKIMRAMPKHISSLYFPIVLPGKAILGYQASRCGLEIHIACDQIEIK